LPGPKQRETLESGEVLSIDYEYFSSLLYRRQGLTLVHFSAHLEPCLTHKNTLHTLNTP
jgi:hypothetical protein